MEIAKKRMIDDIVLLTEVENSFRLEVFNLEQLAVIEEMLLYGIDMIDFFAAHRFNADQMFEIFDGAKAGVEFTTYMEEDYNYLQMRIIKYGLQMNIDISKYADPRFTWDQMYQIYAGLVDNIDVDSYADYNVSVFDMIKMRKELKAA